MKNQIKLALTTSIVLSVAACSPTSLLGTDKSQDTMPVPVTSNPPVGITQHQTATRFSTAEIQKLINLHNQVRYNVGVGEISWSNEVASTAQKWADQLGTLGCNMRHSQSRYGENLFMGWGGHHDVDTAVKAWESEKQYYHGQTIDNSNFSVFGHYTQIVWRNTREIGCGKATCGQKIVMVCNYNPAGNFIGQKPY